ncbi:hypothetical protein Q427_18500 [Halomonas sp. BC04]|nr:hypothetical protein Q427_18500 [Halomonas sp. BC04]
MGGVLLEKMLMRRKGGCLLAMVRVNPLVGSWLWMATFLGMEATILKV